MGHLNLDKLRSTPLETEPYEYVVVPGFLPDDPVIRQELSHYFSSVRRADDAVGHILAALAAAGEADDTLVMFLSDHGMPFTGAKASSFDSGHHCPLLVINPQQKNQGIHNLVEAVIDFLEARPDAKALITQPEAIGDALDEKNGTWIVS